MRYTYFYMNISQNPQYDFLKIIGVIAVFAGVATFASLSMRVNPLEQTGRVIDQKVSMPTVLNVGTKDAEVQKLEQFLKDKKYFAGIPDTTFGRETEDAVKKFQATYQIKPTGTFGGKWDPADPARMPPGSGYVPTACDADFNHDGWISVADLLIFLQSYGDVGQNIPADLDQSDVVGVSDLIYFIGFYGQIASPCPAMILLGGADYTNDTYVVKNDIWKSYDGVNWTNISPNNPSSTTKWLPRSGMSAVASPTDLYVLGGVAMIDIDTTEMTNEVWSSSNGSAWLEHPNASWSPRMLHSTVYFNGNLWVMGGHGGAGIYDYKNDVWKSVDGNTWQLVTESAPWSPRSDANLISYNGKMYLINGRGGPGINYTDVWSSVDGINWTLETNSTPFQGSGSQFASVWNGKLYVAATIVATDQFPTQGVWSSTNGSVWMQEMAPPQPWDMRGGDVLIGFQNALYVVGGGEGEFTGPGDIAWDIWKSLNGSTWTQLIEEPAFGHRANHVILHLSI